MYCYVNLTIETIQNAIQYISTSSINTHLLINKVILVVLTWKSSSSHAVCQSLFASCPWHTICFHSHIQSLYHWFIFYYSIFIILLNRPCFFIFVYWSNCCLELPLVESFLFIKNKSILHHNTSQPLKKPPHPPPTPHTTRPPSSFLISAPKLSCSCMPPTHPPSSVPSIVLITRLPFPVAFSTIHTTHIHSWKAHNLQFIYHVASVTSTWIQTNFAFLTRVIYIYIASLPLCHSSIQMTVLTEPIFDRITFVFTMYRHNTHV